MHDKQLISNFVHSSFSKGITSGSFSSTVILADMKGFTRLTDKAMEKGVGGAEWISNILSTTFTPLIDFVNKEGGFIAEFEGDAALVVFSGSRPELLERVVKLLEIASLDTSEQISFSTSISFGTIYWGIDGAEGINYQLFYGEPVADIFKIRTHLPKQCEWKFTGSKDFVFFSASIMEKNFSGEFRTVYSAFIALDVSSTDEAQLFFKSVCKHSSNSAGFLSGTYLRGTTALALVVFGAPKALESDPRRCGQFVLSMRNEFPGLSSSITSGIAYAGFVGSKKRCNYTVHGTSVNLASRLCEQASPGEVLINTTYSELVFSNFVIEKGHLHVLKGYNESQISFRLLESKTVTEKAKEKGSFIGRKEELLRLIVLQKQAFKISKLTIVNILGEPGIGKSRVLNEFLNILSDDIVVILLIGDELKSSTKLYPWHAALKVLSELLFEKVADRITIQEAKREFRDAIKYVKKLKDLLVLPKYSYEKMAYCISVLLHFVSATKPIVIAVENIHYLDLETIQLLNLFSIENQKSRSLIITTCRIKDQIPEYFISDDNIQITALTASETSEKLLTDTGIIVQDAVAQKLFFRSAGNPLYLEELSLLVKQEQLEGTWSVWQNLNKILPSTLASLLESRIDNLPTDLKDAVFIASVLGFEFDSQILRHMLPINSPAITRGLISGMWEMGSRGKLAFKQQLLRETAYNMQLIRIRRKIHYRAAEVILQLNPQPIDDLLVSLAIHSARADHSEIAIKYLEKAADYCRTTNQNQRAIELYSELERFTLDSNTLMRANGKKCAVLEVSGRWEKALEILQLSLKKADINSALVQHSGRMRISAGKILMQQGKLHEAISILKEAEEILSDASETLKSAVYANLGAAWSEMNSFKKAEKYLNYWYDIAKKREDKYSQVMAVGTLAVLAERMGESEKATHFYVLQLELGRAIKQPLFVAHSYLAFGNTKLENGDYNLALDYFQKSLKIYKQLGNRSGESVAFGGIGKLSLYRQDFSEALRFSTFFLNVCVALGRKSKLFDAYCQLFEVYLYSGDLVNALGILTKMQSASFDYMKDDLLCTIEYLNGLLEMKKRNFYSALKFFRLSAEHIQNNNKILGEIIFILIGLMCIKTKDFLGAKNAFNQIKNTKMLEKVPVKNQIYRILKEVRASLDPNLLAEIELVLSI